MRTCVTTKVYFEATGLVISLITARVSAGKLAHFSKMGSVVGEQGAEGDESLLTS